MRNGSYKTSLFEPKHALFALSGVVLRGAGGSRGAVHPNEKKGTLRGFEEPSSWIHNGALLGSWVVGKPSNQVETIEVR